MHCFRKLPKAIKSGYGRKDRYKFEVKYGPFNFLMPFARRALLVKNAI